MTKATSNKMAKATTSKKAKATRNKKAKEKRIRALAASSVYLSPCWFMGVVDGFWDPGADGSIL